jgi:hypothetical protein
MLAFQPLRAFLNAVKHDLEAFAIPLVACLSIIDSLWDDLTSQLLVTVVPGSIGLGN